MKNLIKLFNKKAQLAAGLLTIVIALIIGTVMLSIVGTLTNATTLGFTGLTYTVVQYIAVGLAVTLLVIAFGAARGGE